MATQDDFFRIVETRDHANFSHVKEVLAGRLACVVYRNYAGTSECADLLERFLSHDLLRSRSGDAVGLYLGTFHWRKTPSEYQSECRSLRSAVASLTYSDHGGAWRRFRDSLGKQLALDRIMLRDAIWDSVPVVTPLVRAWEGSGAFSLVPHEDSAQIRDPLQQSFEVQKVSHFTSCSANLCIANGKGGDLVLWNFIPSDRDRAAFGTVLEGGPYPIGALAAFKRLSLKVQPGDLYVFNGGLVHAVEATSARRATVSTLLGMIAEDTVVMWT